MVIDDGTRELRANALASPFFFIKVLLQNPDLAPHIHGADLEKLIARMKGGWSNRYNWIEYPRGFLKTTTFTQGLSVWFLLPSDDKDRQCAIDKGICSAAEWDSRAKLRNQNYAQLVAFETAQNAEAKIAHVRRFFEDYRLFRAAFPEIAYQGNERPWGAQALTIRRDPNRRMPPDPTFTARGVGGALQSTHFDIIWADDIVGKDAIKSEIVMQDTIGWFGLLNGVEELGGKTWRFGVSNRWGFNDLNSHLRLNEPHWHFFRRDAWSYDEKGERVLTWPEVYSFEVLEQKRASMTDDEFNCQYLNDPKPAGDMEFSPEKVHRFEMEKGIIKCSCGSEYPIEGMNRYLHYDPYSAKGRQSKSLPAIAAVGVAPNNHKFLLEPFTKKVNYDRVFNKLFEMNTRWDPLLMSYEDVGAQNMTEKVIKDFQRRPDFKEKGYREFRRIKPVTTGGKPMEIRVRDHFAPVVEKGQFGVHKNHHLLLEMMKTFPLPVPGHDYDLLDVLAQGARVWKAPMDDEKEGQFQQQEEEYLSKLGQGYTTWAA